MFRNIMILFIVFFVFILGGLFIFINTFDLNKFLPQLTGQLSQTLGRQVLIEKAGLQLSLKHGIMADIQGISLAENDKFSKEPFLQIGNIHCGVNVLALLTKRQVAITSIVIQSLQVTIIRNEAGLFNYESLLENVKPSKGSQAASSSNTEKSVGVQMSELLVNSFEISGARIVYSDRGAKPVLNVALENINAKVSNFSLSEPFNIQLDASVFAEANNIHFQSTGRIDMGLKQIRCDDLRLSFDLGALDLARMNKDIPALAPVGIQPGVKGMIEVTISQMVLGPKGLLVLSLDGKLTEGRIPLKKLIKPIDQLNVTFNVNESRVKVSDLSFMFGSGRVSGEANIKEYMSTQGFELVTNLEGILVQETIDQSQSPARLKGSLAGTFKFAGQGFTPDALNKVAGQAQLALTDGELTNVNIIKSILERVPVLSALSAVAGTQVSQDWQTKLGGELTKIEKAQIKARIANGSVLLDEAQLKSEKFSIAGNGKAGFDQTVDMAAELIMSKELSDSVIDLAGDMKDLADEKGKIRFPVKITGKVPMLSYMPDVAYISKQLIVNKGGGALQKVLDRNPEAKKFLDIFTGSSEDGQGVDENASDAPQEPAQDGAQQKGSSGREFLEGILKNF